MGADMNDIDLNEASDMLDKGRNKLQSGMKDAGKKASKPKKAM